MNIVWLSTFSILYTSGAYAQAPGQPILPSTLPACAQTCPNLIQGQNACIAPVNPPPGGTYGIPCLCAFPPLGPLKADAPAQLCATCSPTDNTAIQAWFKGACGLGGGATPSVNGQTTSTTTPTSTLSTKGPAPTFNGATAGNSANRSNDPDGSWISTHWKWVLMLIILALGLVGLAVGGVYLRRYIHRRRDAREFSVSGPRQDLETWGPGQSVHDFGPAGAGNVDSGKEKGKEAETVINQEATNDRRNSRRLKKGWLPGRK